MADQREMILRIPTAYYRELEHIAKDIHLMPPSEMAEKVVMTFVDNMRAKIYPRITDINKEFECQPTNTSAGDAEPSPTRQDP